MLRMPRTFTRQPRSIGDMAFYKASEYLNFLIHYGPVILDNILPSKYLNHFSLLSNAIFIFNKTSINSDDFKSAESSLKKFHLEFAKLYGEHNLVYNTHLLTHIPQCVRNFGPLWAFSNFPFEDFNGVLKSYVSGTTDVLQQIVSKHLITLEMNRLKTPFWEAVCRTKRVKKFETVGAVKLFGNGEKPSTSLKKCLNSVRPDLSDVENIKSYKSCIYLGETLTVFKKNVKCMDSIFKTSSTTSSI